MKDDRGELDMTKQLEEKDQLIQELRMRIRDMLMISEQHRNILGEEIDNLIQELRMRVRDMLLISEQHRSILGDEITHRKRLEKEIKDLKVQMSEYLSVRVKGARDNAG